jgi:hypothetical protein
MSKAPFRMPPRAETPNAKLDQWVAGGQRTEAPESKSPSRSTGKLARLTIDLPTELHAKFKATCALKGTRMIEEVRRFIEDWIQKNE